MRHSRSVFIGDCAGDWCSCSGVCVTCIRGRQP